MVAYSQSSAFTVVFGACGVVRCTSERLHSSHATNDFPGQLITRGNIKKGFAHELFWILRVEIRIGTRGCMKPPIKKKSKRPTDLNVDIIFQHSVSKTSCTECSFRLISVTCTIKCLSSITTAAPRLKANADEARKYVAMSSESVRNSQAL
jgi:hypothetical protein